jgi:hypothetical protein
MFKSENDRKRTNIANASPSTIGDVNSNSTLTQVTIETDSITGTIAFEVIARQRSTSEDLTLNGSVFSLDLTATNRTFIIPFGIRELTATPTGLTGTDWNLLLSSGTF